MLYDYLVVGAGLYGAVFAQQAMEQGKRVLVVEKRPQIGGNLYTQQVEGITVHKYGAHIFHTNDPEIWDYITRFARFNRFVNRPVANYKGELYSLPFNMYTFYQMWGTVTPQQAQAKLEVQRREITGEPCNLEEQAIALVGRDLYEKLVQGYTEKQWGRPCRELPPFIIRRLPVRLTYDNDYFDARYQGVPEEGYTALIARMLAGAELRLGVDYLACKPRLDILAKRVIYTGPLDAYFGYRLGSLEYRSLTFEEEVLPQTNYQGNAVVNYTDRETPWTRIIEHKWFQFGRGADGAELDKTVISREYSAAWRPGAEPYYPVNNIKNEALRAEYQELAAAEPRVRFGGRLGEYRYYDMDQVIAAALTASREELGRPL